MQVPTAELDVVRWGSSAEAGEELTLGGRHRLFTLACQAALTRGRPSLARRRRLREWRDRLEVSPEEARLLAELARHLLVVRLGGRPAEQQLALQVLLEVILADGVAPTWKEMELLHRVSEHAGWAPSAVGRLVAERLRARAHVPAGPPTGWR